MLGARPVTATYRAAATPSACACRRPRCSALAAASAPFADFLNRRILHLLELSRRALQAACASQALAEQSLEAPLAIAARASAADRAADTPLARRAGAMHERRVGSVLVTTRAGAALGILTRHDMLDRVMLPQLPLDTPIAAVMSTPVHTLSTGARAARRGAADVAPRHPPRARDRAPDASSASSRERDLFALQRLSLKQVGSAMRAAPDMAALRAAAGRHPPAGAQPAGQGVQARQLTELISHLNDLLTERLVQLLAAQHGPGPAQACWLAFGSEGRGEQTIATDQDNGLVFDSDDPERDRPALAGACARACNEALDACGYPLCKGGVMAGQPGCCLTPAEWLRALRALDRPRRAGGPAGRQHLLRPAAARRQCGAGAPLRESIDARGRAAYRASSSRWPTTRCGTARR